MQIEENTYLKDYFGMIRDSFVKEDDITIIFYAIMNDDVCFTFKRKRAKSDNALTALHDYIDRTQQLEAGLPYNAAAIKQINSAIRTFMKDIILGKIKLPDPHYEFTGNKAYLETLLQDESCTFLWHY